jgi:hypothetical protein
MAQAVRGTLYMNAETNALKCPVCGAQMKVSKLSNTSSTTLIRVRCTCGHSEDRKEDGTEVLMTHSLMAMDGCKELRSKGK